MAVRAVRLDTHWEWHDEHFDEGAYEVRHAILAADSTILGKVIGVMIDKERMHNFHTACSADYDALPLIVPYLFNANGYPINNMYKKCKQYNCDFSNTKGRFVYIDRILVGTSLNRLSARTCDLDEVSSEDWERELDREPVNDTNFANLRVGLAHILFNKLMLSTQRDCAMYIPETTRDEALFRSVGFTSLFDNLTIRGWCNQLVKYEKVMFVDFESLTSAINPLFTSLVPPCGWSTIEENGDYLIVRNEFDSTLYISKEFGDNAGYEDSNICVGFKCSRADDFVVNIFRGKQQFRLTPSDYWLEQDDFIEKLENNRGLNIFTGPFKCQIERIDKHQIPSIRFDNCEYELVTQF